MKTKTHKQIAIDILGENDYSKSYEKGQEKILEEDLSVFLEYENKLIKSIDTAKEDIGMAYLEGDEESIFSAKRRWAIRTAVLDGMGRLHY